MKFSFTAIIYKSGINLCVDVPATITRKMVPEKGYIPVKGTINKYNFTQTLVPVKNASYRLFVNGIMLKGSLTRLGDRASFCIEQNTSPAKISMPGELRRSLKEQGLLATFNKFSPSRQKEIFRYLNHLKTADSLHRNIQKVIAQLQQPYKENKGFLRSLVTTAKKNL